MDDLYKVYVYSLTDIMDSWSNNAILSVFAIILGQHQCRLPNNFNVFNNVPRKYLNGSKRCEAQQFIIASVMLIII